MAKKKVRKSSSDEISKLRRSVETQKAVIVILAFVAALFAVLALLLFLGIINVGTV